MVPVGVMIEGQEDLTWERWIHLCRLVESLGFESLWRSDHFHSLAGVPEREALETWTSLAVAARETSRVRLGPLVCSVTFRHPSLLARMAAAVDRLSGGRLTCGIGAGWNESEHRAFGLPFPSVPDRMDMLDEQAQVLRLLWSGEPASFEGRHYRLDGARCLPTPAQRPMPLLVGGSGERRTLRTAALYAQEWNAYGMTVEAYRGKVERLREHCKDVGRDFGAIRRSWMGAFVVGADEKEVEASAARVHAHFPALGGMSVPEATGMLRRNGWLVGTPEQIAAQMRERMDAGVQAFMLQHHLHDDDEALALLAREVVPRLRLG